LARICVLGIHHLYQQFVCRKNYARALLELIDLHGVDLVAEEATASSDTHAHKAVNLLKSHNQRNIEWMGIEITADERKHIPDSNPRSIGTLVDFDFYMTREWIWVARTAKHTKTSTLVICGLAHTFSVAEKFRSIGFDVETNLFLAKSDDDLIRYAPTDCN